MCLNSLRTVFIIPFSTLVMFFSGRKYLYKYKINGSNESLLPYVSLNEFKMKRFDPNPTGKKWVERKPILLLASKNFFYRKNIIGKRKKISIQKIIKWAQVLFNLIFFWIIDSFFLGDRSISKILEYLSLQTCKTFSVKILRNKNLDKALWEMYIRQRVFKFTIR